jgi:hypothetical protein
VSGRRKLSDAAREFIIDSVTRRRELERKLSMYPTNAELADEFEVSERWIACLVQNGARAKVSRETKNNADTSLRVNNPE